MSCRTSPTSVSWSPARPRSDQLLFAEPCQLPLDHGELPEEEAGQEDQDRGKERDDESERLVEIKKADIPGVNSDEDEIKIKTSVSYLSN